MLAVDRQTSKTIDTSNSQLSEVIEMTDLAAATEGAADFAFGVMPRFPHNPQYLQGWISELLKRVKPSEDEAVYPEQRYRPSQTFDPNGIFSETPVISPQ